MSTLLKAPLVVLESWSDSSLAKLPHDDLLSLKSYLISNKYQHFIKEDNKIFLLDSVFSQIFNSLKNSEGLSDYRIIACDCLSIWILRSNQIISISSATAIEYNHLVSHLLDEETLTFLYQYVIDFWSDAGSSLSNALKDMFSKLLILMNNLKFNDKENFKNTLIKNWLISIFNTLSYTTRVYYFMVENLSKNLLDEPDFVLNYNKNFLTNSIKIMYSSTLANISSKAIQTVLKNLYTLKYEKESKDLEWLNIWCNTVIENLYDVNLKKNVSTYLLPYLFKISKDSTIEFISIIKEKVNNSSDNNKGNEIGKDISLLLECLKIAQELAIIVEPFDIDQNIEPIISINDLKLLLINENPFFRISSLSLLTFSPKNSKVIKPYIFNIIYEFLPILFIENDIEIRNILFSILKNFIIRIRDSSYSINRELINLNKKLDKKKLDNDELILIDNLKTSLIDYQNFLNKLIDLVHLNLLPGLSYQKVSFALKLLNCIIKSGLDNRIEKKHLEKNHIDYPFNIEIYNKNLFRLLLDNISDEFNDIRQTSTEILNMSPVPISEILKDDNNNDNVHSEVNDLDLYFNRSELMIKDIKGRKGDSGARFFQLLFQNYQSNNEIPKCLGILNTLTSNLKNSIDYLESNLIFAIYKENIHGYYSSLRFIFEIIEFEKFIDYSTTNGNDDLLALVNSWIQLIIKNWELTKFFLQNDSPEGFDNLEIEPDEADEIEKLIENYGPITQILSSYSWRSMKESSSLLKEIFDKSPSNYFQIDQVSTIGGDILIEQLSTIRHRGAFSSVYPTFISCCIRCKTYGKSDIVKQWLDDCIDNILKLKYNQYITRRSAGIPFLITAILTSEVEYNKKSKKFSLDLIEYTIDKLLNISKLSIDSIESNDANNDSTNEAVVVKLDKIDLPQVNAINCIRSIFIESSLSDVSIFFIDKVLDLCLSQFDSPIWSIRNCSVMLFSALQNKLFGCKKRKKMNLNSEDSVKPLTVYSITNIETLNNLPTVSSRLFFSKFKDTKEILYKNLKGSIQDTDNNDNENIERIFPILTVLSRLEATNNYKGLIEFKPLIFKCLEKKIYKIREMASKSLPCIITDDEILSTCSELIEQAVTTNDMNKCHGYIFAIKELILSSISRKDEIDSTENNLSSGLINKIYSYFGEFINNTNGINDNYPIQLLYLQIVAILNDYKQLDTKMIDQLGNWFINENLTRFELNGAKQLSLSISCDILLNHYLHSGDDDNGTTIDFIEFAINSDYFEVVLKIIEICNLKIEYLSNDIVKLLIEYLWKIILNESEWSFTKSRSLDLLKNLLLMNNSLDISQNEEDSDDKDDDFTKKISVLTQLIEESDNEDIKCNCLETLSPFIYYYLVKLELDDNKFGFFKKWIKNVERFNNDDNSFNFRKASIKSLILILNLMIENKELKFKASEYYGSCIFQLFSFLFDDDEELRNMSSVFISKKLMNLKFSVLPISVIKNFNQFIQDEFDSEEGFNVLLKLIKDYNLFNEINKNYENFCKLFIEDYLLFTIEKQNLYKNQIVLNNIKNSLFLSLSKKDEKSNKLIVGSINSDRIHSTLSSIYNTVKDQDIDGAFGWTDDEDIFNTISCCLSDCATYDELTNEKNFGEVAHKLYSEFKAKKVHYILSRQLEKLL